MLLNNSCLFVHFTYRWFYHDEYTILVKKFFKNNTSQGNYTFIHK